MNIVDNAAWDDVYLIETSDYVLGGVEGTSNEQAKALANRTRYLRDLLEAIETEIASMPTSNVMNQALLLKADKNYADTELGKKADKSYTDNKLGLKADKTYLDDGFATKTLLATKADKSYTDSKLLLKADKSYVDDGFATKTLLAAKADKSYTDTKLSEKTDKNYTDTELGKKADKSYVDNNFLAAIKGITVTSGEVQTTNRTTSFGTLMPVNYNYNFADIFPPTGFTMSNMIGFMCSPALIYFNGDVNSDDTLFCRWRKELDRVRVICQNSENRAVSSVNYLAMWQK